MGGRAGAEPWTGQQGDSRNKRRGRRGEVQGDSQIWGLDDWTPRKTSPSLFSLQFLQALIHLIVPSLFTDPTYQPHGLLSLCLSFLIHKSGQE